MDSEDFNKLWNKTKEIIKKETNEIKKIVHYKELNKDMEILKKKKPETLEITSS
jgi:histidinol phosphatase-like enzyme